MATERPKRKANPPAVIGSRDWVSLPKLGVETLRAKVEGGTEQPFSVALLTISPPLQTSSSVSFRHCAHEDRQGQRQADPIAQEVTHPRHNTSCHETRPILAIELSGPRTRSHAGRGHPELG